MISKIFSFPAIALLLNYSALAQTEQTFYRTNTTYEGFQLDKAPFAMKKLTIIAKDESVTIGGITFYKSPLKNGGAIYLSGDRKSYLLVIDKEDQVGFIVSPNGKDWSCYFKYKKAKKENDVPPDDYSNTEVEYLKEALGNLVDPRTKYYYLTYYSFESTANTSFAKDSLAVIVLSADTISVAGNLFTRKTDKVFRNGAYTYLYMPDNETFVFRDHDFTTWASFYKNDKQKADALISQAYTSQKELADANTAIEEMETGKTKNVLMNYFSSLQSKRNDPACANSIIKYWNTHWPGSPATKVIFIDGGFHIARNTLGEPLRRTISAWVVYKKNGKCYTQWHEYGYESAGGGIFINELSQWRMDRSQHIVAQTSQGSEYLHSGDEFEINCNQAK
jgi:hypothetical protein